MKNAASPTKEFHYRELACEMYYIPRESGKWIGYVNIGDTWIELMDRTGLDEETAINVVENNIDRIINDVRTPDSKRIHEVKKQSIPKNDFTDGFVYNQYEEFNNDELF